MAIQSWLEAVRDGIAEEMRQDPYIVYLGEGIGERGGSFAQTKGLWQEFGGKRVIDTPICEMAFTGAALGISATGGRAVADLMFADFLFEAAGQIVLQASKLRYMSNGQMSAPLIVRAPCGAIHSAGPHHSGTYHPIWAHLPGLIVVMPSNPADAKGLMKTALRAADPVLFFEPKALFATKGEVPAGEHLVPFGVANIVRTGTKLTVVTCGQLVRTSLEAADLLEREGVSCEVIDLRTIMPLDVETVAASLGKTGRLLVVDEGYPMFGLGAEIAAAMMELAFDELDAPIGRVHTEPVCHPVSPKLEAAMLVSAAKIVAAAREIMEGRAPIIRRPKIGSSPVGAASPPRPVMALEPTEKVSVGEPTVKGAPLCMPHGDLTVTEATVAKWFKSVGDPIKQGETVVEVETEKAVTPIESPVAGTLAEIVAPEGMVVKMGEPLGMITPSS